MSNTYPGTVTLQVTGLAGGESVVVQKFLDANADSTVDAGDILVQQFNLTDGQAGMVIGGVTNFNVPGDTDATVGQITARLNFRNGDFLQNGIGQYLYVISSPTATFPAVTHTFTVTGYPFGQQLAGNVVNSGTNVSGAVVVVFPPPRSGNHGPGRPVAITVADASGHYSVALPAGTYVPLAFRYGYVADYPAAPVISLTSGGTITTNLDLTNATSTLSGRMVDAVTNTEGLPGVFLPADSSSGLIAIGTTDPDGHFTIPVVSGQWNLGNDDGGLIVHGYVGYQNGTNVNAGESGIIGPVFRATALFYGSVKDNSGHPLTGIDVMDQDANGTFQMDGFTDTNGQYAVGAVAGLMGDGWQVQVDAGSGNFTNYMFSQPAFDMTGGTNFNTVAAVKVNFTALPVTGIINGQVQFNGNPVAGVGVNATTTNNGVVFDQYADTDGSGHYTLSLGDGDWSVSVNCNGGNDSLDNILGQGVYECPPNQSATISGDTATVNFTIQTNQPLTITSTTLPPGTVGVAYSEQLQAAGGNPPYSWMLPNGTASLPPAATGSMSFSSSGVLSGTPSASGTYSFPVTVWVNNPYTAVTQQVSLTINPASQPLQITTAGTLPEGTNGVYYRQTLQASGGVPPYTWSVPNYSANPPANLTLGMDGMLAGTPASTGGPFYFYAQVVDSAAHTNVQLFSVTFVNPSLTITNSSLPPGTVGAAFSAQLGATGGQPPYQWQLALGSATLPAGLTLNASGQIAGTPTTPQSATFNVQVTDNNAATATQVLTIVINAPPTISTMARLNNGQFALTVKGAANQTYTVLMTTNLSNDTWSPLITTNTASGIFLFTDMHATNVDRYYRIAVGP